jgi:quercetin dioxygenase-like cupin family protein
MGYGDCRFKDFAANTGGPLHTHDFSVMLLVVSGTLTLANENGATAGSRFIPGQRRHPAAARSAQTPGVTTLNSSA